METVPSFDTASWVPLGSDINKYFNSKYYARPVDVKTKPGDVIEPGYESYNDGYESPVPSDVEFCKINFVTVATQTDYRESEAQTDPWDPPFVVEKVFRDPEVLLLKELTYGNGLPATDTEVQYILESRRNRYLDVPTESTVSYEEFLKKKQHISNQIQNEWDYKISIDTEKNVDKLKELEQALIEELSKKSARQDKLLKNLWTKKKEQMAKMNSKIQKDLKKELMVLEKKLKSDVQQFDAKACGLNRTSKDLTRHINKNEDSLNREIDFLSKYHMTPDGLKELTGWLERKKTLLYNEVPIAKPLRQSQRERLIDKAYKDLLVSYRPKMPPRRYREDYEEEETASTNVRAEFEFEELKLPDEGIDLVTVWNEQFQGRAYYKQMFELTEKHKHALDKLLSRPYLLSSVMKMYHPREKNEVLHYC